MKTFWNIIGIWFLWQLVTLSVADSTSSLVASNQGTTQSAKCDAHPPAIVGVIVGILFPIIETPLVYGEWCWQDRKAD